ncbi:DNA internalization-related competence protein ComEC/Rec2 [Aromatoleum toluvorans]|uniref:DNA internalization-related competence protein ComEC/Rec2 n=2 Tax=Aromatoleum toluvorans TaxID=92002 RepID=A0ABX1PTM3_9RHOO|nr:DNA internalization-related competence protein ComEC/Rec2 [Aromatoleum toluvorans]
MQMAIISFAAGIWIAQYQPRLLSGTALILITTGLTIGGAAALQWYKSGVLRENLFRALVLLVAFGVGFAWSGWRAAWRIADELPPAWEGRDVEVTGLVAELPEPSEQGVRFVFQVEKAAGPVPQRILLSWYAKERGAESATAPVVRPGERWRFTVRLKRPHGLVNPNGYDYEAALLERGVRATGNVRSGPPPALLDRFVSQPMILVHRLRDAIRDRFSAALPGKEYAGVLIALAVGDQRAIPDEQWTVFRNTGISHLISISGLHVSMVGILVAWLVGKAWRRSSRRMLRLPAMKAAAAAGLVAAAAYAILAGMGIPTQRSLIMLAVVALALLGGRQPSGSQVLCLALLCVLAFDPWAVLAAGFWLSFGAVAILMFLLGGRVAAAKGWRAAVASQLGITLATIPALIVLFNGFSLVSPLANALAIPLVSFVITPLTLLAIVLPLTGLLDLAHGLFGLLMVFLEWLAALPFAMWSQAAPPAILAGAAIAGVVWLMLPRGTPARSAGVLMVLPMLAWVPERPAPGTFRMTVLDVGQGTAVHVQTARHELVYDTGPAYRQGGDAGARVVVPYLQAAGIGHIDRLVVSHNDLDHSGGMSSVLGGTNVGDIAANFVPEGEADGKGKPPVRPCTAGEAWVWDGVEFRVLHPRAEVLGKISDNDASCVLRIAAPGGSVLLAGDIERATEQQLVGSEGPALASTVVVVPHHGSKSSSSDAFVAAVSPRAAIHSAGYLNQFHHPHPSVLQRWTDGGATNWRTDGQGAVLVEVGARDVAIAGQRELAPRYWYGH